MHRYALTYEYFGETIHKNGESLEKIDEHELLFNLLEAEGKPVYMLVKNSGGPAGYKDSLERTKYRNVKIRWT